MKFLITLPDHPYYLWQMLVQINNFRKLGLENDTIYVIGKTGIQMSSTLKNIMKNGKIKSNFYIFNDERKNKRYSASLRPFLIKKLFQEFTEKQNDIYFYTDPDVIFINKINFNELLNDNVWYLSDTRSYLNSAYIKSKGEELFIEMCNIVKILPEIVQNNDNYAGGAQLLIKNTNVDFWEKVENDSEDLYKFMKTTEYKYNPNYPIQSWTAEMWATLWNAWLWGNETKIYDDFNFSCATDNIEKWNITNIYHNAGAVIDDGTYFLKTKYQLSPFNKIIECSNKYCSFNYLKEVRDTEINFKHIIF